MIRVPLSIAAAGLTLAGAASAAAQSQDVDLDRFSGRWFEVARNHNTVQKDCSRAQIDFTPRDTPDRYAILVTCTRRPGGHIETLRANGRVTDTATNAKFRFTLTGLLSFGGLVGQNYWIWDHAPDYGWAILALPDKSSWWIWRREPNPSQATRDRLVERARALGFGTERIVHTHD